jgi:hypothetical protein
MSASLLGEGYPCLPNHIDEMLQGKFDLTIEKIFVHDLLPIAQTCLIKFASPTEAAE